MSLHIHIDNVMQPLVWEVAPHLAVAVSGGADSMALALLMQRWATVRQGRISAVVVDHGLRPESKDEARQTVAWLQQHAIEAYIVSLALAANPHAVQERARQARYDALSAWCRQHEVLHLMVGHHRDDQAETMLFRLTRHSGLSGLAAMPLVREHDGVRLIRPLLGVSKASLETYLRERGQPWAHDPSNDQTRFTRIQFRQLLARLSHLLSSDPCLRIAILAKGFGKWRSNHERHVNHALCRWVTASDKGVLQVHQHIAILPHALQQAIWQAVLGSVGNQATPPRGTAIERLMQALAHQARYALHGCDIMLNPKQSCWVVSKAPYKDVAGNLEDFTSLTYMKDNAKHGSENHERVGSCALKTLAPAPFSAMNTFL